MLREKPRPSRGETKRIYRSIKSPEGVKKRGRALIDFLRIEKTPVFSCFWIASLRQIGAQISPTSRRRTRRKLQTSISSALGDRKDLMFAVVTAKSPDVAIVVMTVFSAVIGNHSIAPITTWQNQISGRDLMNNLKNPVFFICTSSSNDCSKIRDNSS